MANGEQLKWRVKCYNLTMEKFSKWRVGSPSRITVDSVGPLHGYSAVPTSCSSFNHSSFCRRFIGAIPFDFSYSKDYPTSFHRSGAHTSGGRCMSGSRKSLVALYIVRSCDDTQQIPLPPLYRLVSGACTSLTCRLGLLIMGYYWIQTETVSPKRGYVFISR